MTTISVFGRAAAGAGALGLILGGALGAGAATAETVGPATGKSDSVSYERSVGGAAVVDGKVKVGDTITVTNKLTRKVGWLVTSVTDQHPSCLQAVPATSVWKVSGGTYTNDPAVSGNKKSEYSEGEGWTKLTPGAGWEATPLVWTQDYKVTCAAGSLATGGLKWGTTNAFENKKQDPDLGPTITVVADTGGGDNGGGDNGGNGNGGNTGGDKGGSSSGSLGSGSLGGLFGSS